MSNLIEKNIPFMKDYNKIITKNMQSKNYFFVIK